MIQSIINSKLTKFIVNEKKHDIWIKLKLIIPYTLWSVHLSVHRIMLRSALYSGLKCRRHFSRQYRPTHYTIYLLNILNSIPHSLPPAGVLWPSEGALTTYPEIKPHKLLLAPGFTYAHRTLCVRPLLYLSQGACFENLIGGSSVNI